MQSVGDTKIIEELRQTNKLLKQIIALLEQQPSTVTNVQVHNPKPETSAESIQRKFK